MELTPETDCPTTINIRINQKGNKPEIISNAYRIKGSKSCKVISFYIDCDRRTYVSASSKSDTDCPLIYLYSNSKDESYDDIDTEIELIDFPGWSFHSSGDGTSLAICITKDEIDY